MPNIQDPALKKFYEELTNNPDTDLEKAIDEYCFDCITPDDVLKKIDDATMLFYNIRGYSWIEHNGKKILYVDTSSAVSQTEGNVAPVGTYFIARLYRAYPEGAKVYTLYNLSKVRYNSKMSKATVALKLATNRINNNAAVYGLNSIQKIIAQAASRKENVYFAKSREDALEWLDKR